MKTMLEAAKAAKAEINRLTTEQKNAALHAMADALIAQEAEILAANALGIGSVWLGTWPQPDRVKAQAELFGLPETQIPHSIIAFGYPKEEGRKEKLIWEEDRVHYEKW